jgi:hypothetical protein
MSAMSSFGSDQRFVDPGYQCDASIEVFAIVILVRVLFLPTLVRLLDTHSEPPDSISLLLSLLLFRASSYVKTMNDV